MTNYLAVGVNITDITDIINIMQKHVETNTQIDDIYTNFYLERLSEAFELSSNYNIFQHIFNNYIGQLPLLVLDKLSFCNDIKNNIIKYIKLPSNFIVSAEINYIGELITPNLPFRRQTQYPYSLVPEGQNINSIFIGIRVVLDDRSPAYRYNSVNFYLNMDEIKFYTNVVTLLLKSLDIVPNKYIDKILIRNVNK